MDLEDYQLNMVKKFSSIFSLYWKLSRNSSNELQHLFIDLINNYKSLLGNENWNQILQFIDPEIRNRLNSI